uniref:Uncharacterized protein n=1 Tax=Branchiostoma floridae TaxID=7739 RepID=C3Y3J7_BRAFL|eukprot:XP_002608863.1 hypothetical protein BRAFLDRAFT_102052 [Branchiostoma floridae]
MFTPKAAQSWAYLLVCLFAVASCPAFAEEQDMSPDQIDSVTSGPESQDRVVNGCWAYTFEVPAPLDVPTCADVHALRQKVDDLKSSVTNHVIHLSNKMHDISDRIDDVLTRVELDMSTDKPRQADEGSEAGEETHKYPKGDYGIIYP